MFFLRWGWANVKNEILVLPSLYIDLETFRPSQPALNAR